MIAAVLSGTTIGSAAVAEPSKAAGLIERGSSAYAAGQFEQARDAFAAACAAEPKNRQAACDLGVALLRLDQATKAGKPLEQAAAGVKVPDRPLVMALACYYVSAKSPMQAVKPILAYVKAHPEASDEPLVDALAVAVAQAQAKGVRTALLTEGAATCQKMVVKLEAARPGEKRWALQWVPAAEVAGHRTAAAAAQQTIAKQTGAIRQWDGKVADARRQRDALPDADGNNNITQKRAALQKQIDDWTAARDTAAAEVEAARKTAADNQPAWPDRLPTDGLVLPTASSAATAN